MYPPTYAVAVGPPPSIESARLAAMKQPKYLRVADLPADLLERLKASNARDMRLYAQAVELE